MLVLLAHGDAVQPDTREVPKSLVTLGIEAELLYPCRGTLHTS